MCSIQERESSEELKNTIRKGQWSFEEDSKLINYIAIYGQGRWNSLAHKAGLKRTGKSCRLRWLNYLRPDVRRGNFTQQEHISIIDLYSCYGNRWSKIAQHLPGRTDNEIKNYWRTRVKKQAKQLKVDVNSLEFRDLIRNQLFQISTRRHTEIGNNSENQLLNHDSPAGLFQINDCYSYQEAAAAPLLYGSTVSTEFHNQVSTVPQFQLFDNNINIWSPDNYSSCIPTVVPSNLIGGGPVPQEQEFLTTPRPTLAGFDDYEICSLWVPDHDLIYLNHVP